MNQRMPWFQFLIWRNWRRNLDFLWLFLHLPFQFFIFLCVFESLSCCRNCSVEMYDLSACVQYSRPEDRQRDYNLTPKKICTGLRWNKIRKQMYCRRSRSVGPKFYNFSDKCASIYDFYTSGRQHYGIRTSYVTFFRMSWNFFLGFSHLLNDEMTNNLYP